jgi:DNA-binding HxlR family transcriptional regulator
MNYKQEILSYITNHIVLSLDEIRAHFPQCTENYIDVRLRRLIEEKRISAVVGSVTRDILFKAK